MITDRGTMISPLRLRICDAEGLPSIGLAIYSGITYTERFADRDSFEFTISRKEQHAAELIPGRIVLVPADEQHDTMRALIIRQIEVDDTEITVSGTDYVWDLFGARISLAGTDSGTGYDTQTGPAETVARHYISANITAAADARRRDANVELETAHAEPYGSTVTIEARYQTLQEILESVCTQGGIGICGTVREDNTRPTGWYIEINILSGTDRSQTEEEP